MNAVIENSANFLHLNLCSLNLYLHSLYLQIIFTTPEQGGQEEMPLPQHNRELVYVQLKVKQIQVREIQEREAMDAVLQMQYKNM